MANGNENGKSPTWKWLACILVTVMFLMVGGYVSKLDSEVAALKRDKVDQSRYDCDLQKLDAKIDRMDGKLDRLLMRGTR